VKVCSRALATLSVLTLIAATGCGSGDGLKLHPLSGKITVNGAPPTNYIVYLVSTDPDGTGANLVVEDDGSYVARSGREGREGAVAGNYKVVLQATLPDPGEGGVYGGGATPGAVPGTASLPQELAAYGNKETSPKEITVEAGPNTIDIAIP
jgi:hypothetical protein